MTRRCESCDAWSPNGQGTQGTCRRLPPAAGAPKWPLTAPTDWCAEWVGNEPANPFRESAA